MNYQEKYITSISLLLIVIVILIISAIVTMTGHIFDQFVSNASVEPHKSIKTNALDFYPNTISKQILPSIKTGSEPRSIAINPDTNMIYVDNFQIASL